MSEYHIYQYDGPVMKFGKCINKRFKGETMALTESKAKTNLAYQFKKKYNMAPEEKITLPGKITLIREG